MLSHQLWNRLDPQFSHAILCHVQASHKPVYRTLVDLLAPLVKMRVAKIMEMPKAERHTKFLPFLGHPQFEPMSLQVFVHWLGDHPGKIPAVWLDALSIPHDGRGIIERIPPAPADDVVRAAVETLFARFSPQEVLVFLCIYNQAGEARWPLVNSVLAQDTRLAVGPQAGTAAA